MSLSIDVYLSQIADKMLNLGVNCVSPYSSPSIKLLYLLGYYRYINANDLLVSELEKSIFMEEGQKAKIGAAFLVDEDPPSYDVLCPLFLKDGNRLDSETVIFIIKEIVQEFINPEPGSISKAGITACAKIKETDNLTFKIVTNAKLAPKLKADLRRQLGKIDFPFSGWSADLVDSEDIIEEIAATEDLQKNVDSGFLVLSDPKSFAYHGKEESFVSSVSASSLRDLYLTSGNKGLFASNLRFYVKSLKIDSAIEETIKNHPDDFWYFNNGIIITCSDYTIEGNKLLLKGFSIVNGGQTTAIIGNSDFHKDFAVLCKVIRQRYPDGKASEEFLDGVAAASNSQKPIKPKDLIANRPEQKHLKSVLADYGIFLQIKRGDRINKMLYPQIWQNITNDELAQLIYSGVFQNPGPARNSVSKLFSSEQIYRTIFLQDLSGFFLRDLIIIRSAYQEWISSRNKKNKYHPVRPELAKVGLLYQVATIVLMSKSLYNAWLASCVRASEEDHAKIQFFIGQRDVGFSRILRPDYDYPEAREELFKLFGKIESELLLDGLNEYQRYKGGQGGSAANFVRDSNYYRSHVALPLLTSALSRIDSPALYHPNRDEQALSEKRFVKDYRPGLKTELLSFREIEATKVGKSKEAFISDSVMAQIVRFSPRNNHELRVFTKLDPELIEKYGPTITAIIKKYDEVICDSIVITSMNMNRLDR